MSASDEKLKAIFGDGSPIKARIPDDGLDPFEFSPTMKFFLSSSAMPKPRADDDGIWSKARTFQLSPVGPSPSPFAELREFCDLEITKAVLGPLALDPPSYAPSMIQGLAHIAYTEQKMKEHWQSFLSSYASPRPEYQKPKRPKWGQRGRKRLRKTRIVARAINHLMNEIRRSLQCPKSSLFTMESNLPPMVV